MLWQPKDDRVVKTRMYHFIRQVDKRFPLPDFSYNALYRFSIEHPRRFWKYLAQYFGIKYYGELEPVNPDPSFARYGWFPNVSLNFAENLLLYGEDYKIAIKALSENGAKTDINYRQLKHRVARLQAELRPVVEPGDVLACYMPNVPETVIAMLAATGLGGVFTSTGTELGAQTAVDRLSQSNPKVLVACAGYEYNGEYVNTLNTVIELAAQLQHLEKIIIVDCFDKQPDISAIENAILWQQAMAHEGAEPVFTPRTFSAPLYILYSGDGGDKPKCIVHSVGGVLLQHIKEIGLHTDHRAEKNLFFDTSCSGMMWNWLVSGLFFGGTITLYDGSPTQPSSEQFLRRLMRENINILGTSPSYLQNLQDSGSHFSEFDTGPLETILCAGSTLLPEQFDYVYRHVKSDLMLASISGGTDILGCFFLCNPLAPVRRGELQCRGLGMDLACANQDGSEAEDGGELICRQSFPSQPIDFLNGASGDNLYRAYFNRCDGTWQHGDFAELRDSSGAAVVSRSSAN